jgi:y4mF family transcriptional regulator
MTPIGSNPLVRGDFASYVRERRRANRLNQTELALLAGVGRRFVSELESGKSTLHVDKVNAVLAVFGKRLGLVDAPRPLNLDEP